MYHVITKDVWTKVTDLGIEGRRYFFVGHKNTNASKTAALNVYGRKMGDADAMPLSRADTTSDSGGATAGSVSVTTGAVKPDTSASFTGKVVLMLHGADEILVHEISLTATGTAVYVVGPAA